MIGRFGREWECRVSRWGKRAADVWLAVQTSLVSLNPLMSAASIHVLSFGLSRQRAWRVTAVEHVGGGISEDFPWNSMAATI